MLFAGSDDGVYRIDGALQDRTTRATKVADTGRAMRLRGFEGTDGLFAATETGLHWSADGDSWTDLGVPRERVYAVAAGPGGERLYAGTRPAHVYVSDSLRDGSVPPEGVEWRELDDFQKLPSREEWRLPRHENLAQVRSLCTHPDAPERVVAGVEVGGVHLSDDGGETWAERRGAVHDDIHHLHAPGAAEFVAATGFGLFQTTDAGRSWTRLDEGHSQRYFREAFTHDGTIYAGGAPRHSSTWDDEDDHALFEIRDGECVAVDYPVPDELVIGFCAAGDTVLGVTHRGALLAKRGGAWRRAGTVPTPGDLGGRYLPLAWVDE